MKVLFVCSGNVSSFDVVPFIKEQGEALREHGVDIHYYTVKGKGIAGYLKAGVKLFKALRSKQYDLIHAHFVLSAYTALIGSAFRIPVVLSLMGSDAYGQYVGDKKVIPGSRYTTLMTWMIQPFVSAIISKSDNIARYVYLKNKSFIIPNGIDREKFRSDRSYKEELGLTAAKKTILFLGSSKNVRKNLPLVKDALSYLARTDVELVNPYPVPHDAIPKYLNSVDVLAVPSFMEGSANVIKEAMACNCPVVATDVGDARWVFGNTEGYYLSSFDPKEYAERLEEALAFAEINGRTKGEQRIAELSLDAGSVAQRVIDVYRRVLNKEL